jgi:SpoVK/Ycf46/Vps4 family AAA+-type ATPase
MTNYYTIDSKDFDRRITALERHPAYAHLSEIGQKPVDENLLSSWGTSACDLIEAIRYSTCKDFYQRADEVLEVVRDLISRLEKVSAYFYGVGNPLHQDMDVWLGEAYWHLLGYACDLELADHYFRRSGKSAEIVTDNQRSQGAVVVALAIAERYLDGVGVDKNLQKAKRLFADASDLIKANKDDQSWESGRLHIRQSDACDPKDESILASAASVSDKLWRCGYLAAASDCFRLREHLSNQYLEDDDEQEPSESVDEDDEPDASDESDVNAIGIEELSDAERKKLLEEELATLDGMVGLKAVKAQVNKLVAYESIQQERRKQGILNADAPSRHLVLTGNPGTGKTTVARLLAKIFRLMGVLKKDVFKETDRSGLVGAYLGQTAIKTAEVIKSARGGMLFIDEAYSLTTKCEDEYGQEAVNTLIKAMEDFRSEMIIVVAGYTVEMERFLESNPGLRSRFNTTLTFEDYSPGERLDILQRIGEKQSYVFDDEARKVAVDFFVASLSSKQTAGNGRFVRNFSECCIDQQSKRLYPMMQEGKRLSRTTLSTITAMDAYNAAKFLGVDVSLPVETNVVAHDTPESRDGLSPLDPVFIRHTTVGVLI